MTDLHTLGILSTSFSPHRCTHTKKYITFTKIFRPFTQYFVEVPLAAITASSLLGCDATSLAHLYLGSFSYSSLQILSSSASKNKENPWMSRCVQTFDWYCMSTHSLSILSCDCRSSYWENVFPQWEHWRGFYPVCVPSCLFRFTNWVKLFPHWEHWKGFSPVCILLCIFKFPKPAKLFPHWEHWKGLSPVCVRSCDFRSPCWVKLFPQSKQW